VVLDRETARLLLDPEFPVGFGVSRESGGIAIGHEGANKGYRSAFLAVPHLGAGVIVLTNSDTGDALAAAVIDVVADEFGWPWTGWSTPLWAVLVISLGVVVLMSLSGWLVIKRRRRLRVRHSLRRSRRFNRSGVVP
jgi:hypothetical protein